MKCPVLNIIDFDCDANFCRARVFGDAHYSDSFVRFDLEKLRLIRLRVSVIYHHEASEGIEGIKSRISVWESKIARD